MNLEEYENDVHISCDVLSKKNVNRGLLYGLFFVVVAFNFVNIII